MVAAGWGAERSRVGACFEEDCDRFGCACRSAICEHSNPGGGSQQRVRRRHTRKRLAKTERSAVTIFALVFTVVVDDPADDAFTDNGTDARDHRPHVAAEISTKVDDPSR